jgi:chaperone protein EcpD
MKSCARGFLAAILLANSVLGVAGEQTGAGIFISSTRLIFPSTSRDASLQIFNENDYPVIIQTWIDNGDETIQPDELDTPFVVIPPLIRLQPHENRAVRVLYTQQPLPDDRESVFWFNAQMIPPNPVVSHENAINFSVRIRQKIFFRPVRLKQGSDEWAEKLTCATELYREGEATVRCRNPTPYYATIDSISLHGENETLAEAGGMLAPFSDMDFHLATKVAQGADTERSIELTVIDDEGFMRKRTLQ